MRMKAISRRIRLRGPTAVMPISTRFCSVHELASVHHEFTYALGECMHAGHLLGEVDQVLHL